MMMGYLLILRHGKVSSGSLLCLNHSLHPLILINQLVLAFDAVYSAAMVSGWRRLVILCRYGAIHRVHSISQSWVIDWRLASKWWGFAIVRILLYLHHFHNWLIGQFVVCWTWRRWFRNDAKCGIWHVLGRVRLTPVIFYKGSPRLVSRNIPLLFINRGLPWKSLLLIELNLKLFVRLIIFVIDCNWSLCASYLLYEYLASILVVEQLILAFDLILLFTISITACRSEHTIHHGINVGNLRCGRCRIS